MPYINSDLRQNPLTAAFSYRAIVDEPQTVAELASFLPGIFGFVLRDRPNPDPATATFTEDVSAGADWTIITSGLPAAGQVRYDAERGIAIFNSADDGKDFLVTYQGAGTNATIFAMETFASMPTQAQITVLNALTVLAEDDEFIVADTSAAETKKITMSNAAHAFVKDAFAHAPLFPVDVVDTFILADQSDGGDIKTLTFGNLVGLTQTRPNILINDFRIDQRQGDLGTITNVVNDQYMADRWRYKFLSSGMPGIVDYAHVAIVPPSPEVDRSLELTVVTADSTISAPEFYEVSQVIEGWNWKTVFINGQSFTIGGWIFVTSPGTIGISIINGAENRSYMFVKVLVAGWNFFTEEIIMDTTGTWGLTNNAGAELRFCLAAGANFQNAAGVWDSSNVRTTSAQTNFMLTVTDVFRLHNIFMVPGAPSGQPRRFARLFGDELELCQRYYEKSYNLNVVPGTAGGSGAAMTVTHTFLNISDGNNDFKVSKRTVPSVLLFSRFDGTVNVVTEAGTSVNVGTAVLARSIGYNRFMGIIDGSNPFTLNRNYDFHWTADAEFP